MTINQANPFLNLTCVTYPIKFICEIICFSILVCKLIPYPPAPVLIKKDDHWQWQRFKWNKGSICSEHKKFKVSLFLYPLSRFKSNRCPAVTLSISYLHHNQWFCTIKIKNKQNIHTVAYRNKLHNNYINHTSIHYASSLYHSEVSRSHVATKKNGAPALYVGQGNHPQNHAWNFNNSKSFFSDLKFDTTLIK